MTSRAAEDRVAVWVELVGDLLLHTSPVFPVQALLDQLSATFQDRVAWNWIEPDGSYGFRMHDPTPGWPEPGDMDEWASLLPLHPLVRWFTRTGDLTAMTMERVPARVSPSPDLARSREALPEWLGQQLSLPYRNSGNAHRAFVLGKGGTDFHDEQLTLARRIQPLLSLLARQCRVLESAAAGPEGLTGRELAVLRLLADGCTATAMGRQLGISPRTVEVHLQHVYRKLGVRDRLMAVQAAREHGVLAVGGAGPHHVAVPRATSHADRAVTWRTGLGRVADHGIVW